jgi:hypothetical protein
MIARSRPCVYKNSIKKKYFVKFLYTVAKKGEKTGG